MSKIILSKNTSLRDFIATCEKISACSVSLEWLGQNNDLDAPCGEVVMKYISTPEAQADQGWGIWTIMALYNHLEPDFRLEFFKKVKDPMSAFMLYINLPKITNDEENVLESVFKGKLPTAEKELKKGVVKRKKIITE